MGRLAWIVIAVNDMRAACCGRGGVKRGGVFEKGW